MPHLKSALMTDSTRQLSQSPFAADSDCLELAVRIIKQGVPDYSDAQIARIQSKKSNLREFEKFAQCERPNGKIDFGKFAKDFFPAENEALGRCWREHRSAEKCATEIVAACDRMQQEWAKLMGLFQ